MILRGATVEPPARRIRAGGFAMFIVLLLAIAGSLHAQQDERVRQAYLGL